MSNGDFKRRCAELELIKENCQEAFELIPIWALEREDNWMPSKEAIAIMKKAKESIRVYNELHHNGNGGGR